MNPRIRRQILISKSARIFEPFVLLISAQHDEMFHIGDQRHYVQERIDQSPVNYHQPIPCVTNDVGNVLG